MRRGRNGAQYVGCIANKGHRASLIVRRIYQALEDRDAEKRGLLRVVDESGEDYLYPRGLFAVVDLPSAVTKRLAVATY